MTLLTNQSSYILKKILPFTFMWTMFGLLYVIIEHGLLGHAHYYPSTGNVYSLKYSLIYVTVICSIVGTVIGISETIYIRKLFSKRSFFEKILVKTLIYTFLITCSLTLLSLVSLTSIHNKPIYHTQVIGSLKDFVFNFAFISVTLYAGILNALTLFISDISSHVGQGMFFNFLFGRYHHPIREERIFMFLDMKDSTKHAEKLGHKIYFNLLQQYYALMSKAIIDYQAEIYQYVGDEIILTWKVDKHETEVFFLDCFYQIKKSFESRRKHFVNQFGFLPDFKAGVHCGYVTTGEIGIIKKEILYTGDVINTAARIQGLCNNLKQELLISETLYNRVRHNNSFEYIQVGETKLKGKDIRHHIYAVKNREKNNL